MNQNQAKVTQGTHQAPQTSRNPAGAKVIPMDQRRERPSMRTCFICGDSFHASSRFQRFCDECKEHSELYHFSEWLPAS